ncbi:hypothetical protein WMY93_023289 [Mugilogobius chulae]|uniref:C-type lectin domain-containing protein n=1 Tax=Mugilogobius chulae TaxID=88201 RepID=A0AAW0N4Y4_9GOBI
MTFQREQTYHGNYELKESNPHLEKRPASDNYTSSGWMYFRGSVYHRSSTEQNWQESRKYCQQRGADLIIINNVQELEFASDTFKSRTWIGLSDLEEEGVWRWVDGSLLNTSSVFISAFGMERSQTIKGMKTALNSDLNFEVIREMWGEREGKKEMKDKKKTEQERVRKKRREDKEKEENEGERW